MRKNLIEWMQEDNADVYCFQELKANEEDIDKEAFAAIGYKGEWFSAQKKGYSGVAILSKKPLENVQKGMGAEQADFEGRVIRANIEGIEIINTYFPSGSSGDERQNYKMKFLADYLQYGETLLEENEHLLVAGDYNICHQAIDIHDPVRNKNSSGFLPEEREWMDHWFDLGFIDTFRQVNPHPHQYSWWSYRANARANNKGWRIDYISCNEDLRERITDAGIMSQAMHSDHCPIFVEIN
jgi:exodeoxyribonuclease III